MTRLNIPAPSKLLEETQAEVVLKKLLQMDALFPHLSSVAESILTLPISNAWPERGASSIKRTLSSCGSAREQKDKNPRIWLEKEESVC